MNEEQLNEKEEVERTSLQDYCKTDKADAIGWAAAFVWGGLVLLAESTGFAANYSWWDGWSVFFAGAGVITLLGVVIRLLAGHKWKMGGSLIIGFILLGIGLDGLTDVVWIWPLVLFGIAFVILLGAFTSKR